MINYNANSLSERKGDLRSRKIARFGLVISLFIVIETAFVKIDPVHATDNHVMNLKLFAYQSFNTYDQFDCYNYLVIKESRWNYKAKNGSHYGLGQIKNKMVLKQSPRQQILFHMKYIGHRYGYVNGEPNACRAAEHFDSKGWH